MVKESHNGHRETHPYKRKKVTHRPPPALPHECGDQRHYRDRTANTYARSRVRERKTHFNPNSNGVGSRALRPGEVIWRKKCFIVPACGRLLSSVVCSRRKAQFNEILLQDLQSNDKKINPNPPQVKLSCYCSNKIYIGNLKMCN